MKKNLFTCFLGKVCPYPNIRSSILHHLETCFSVKGLPISSKNDHIAGAIVHVFLSLFFGTVLEVHSQVAQSPLPNNEFRLEEDQKELVPSDSSLLSSGMIYLEVKASQAMDTLWIQQWNQLISNRTSINSGIIFPVLGRDGNLFEGSINQRVFTIPLESSGTHGFISLGKGKETFASQWIYLPTDRVRIRYIQQNGMLLFGGPDAAFYKAQLELDRNFQEEIFNTDPLMFTSRPESIFTDSLSVSLRESAAQKPQDLYVTMQVVGSPESAWTAFKEYSQKELGEHPAWVYLEEHSNEMSPLQLQLLQAKVRGEYLYKGIQKAEMAWELLNQDASKIQELEDWGIQSGILNSNASSPRLVEASFRWSTRIAKSRNISLFEIVSSIPNPLKEEILAFYVLDNFNRLGDRLLPIIDQSLAIVQSEWIKDRLISLRETREQEFLPTGLVTESGDAFDPGKLEGKTLLIHFWISGCKFCLHDFETVMKELSQEYAQNPNILILTVNADNQMDSWKKSLETGKYTSDTAINLWAKPGTGLLKTYGIHSYPQKMVIGADASIQLQTINRKVASELSYLLDSLYQADLTYAHPQTSKQL